MAILNKDDFMNRLRGIIGDDNSDDSLSILEDFTDTYNDLETRATGDGTDWKLKYEENDKSWRERYTSRFFDGSSNDNNGSTTPVSVIGSQTDDVIDDGEDKDFEDLFVEREG